MSSDVKGMQQLSKNLSQKRMIIALFQMEGSICYYINNNVYSISGTTIIYFLVLDYNRLYQIVTLIICASYIM